MTTKSRIVYFILFFQPSWKIIETLISLCRAHKIFQFRIIEIAIKIETFLQLRNAAFRISLSTKSCKGNHAFSFSSCCLRGTSWSLKFEYLNKSATDTWFMYVIPMLFCTHLLPETLWIPKFHLYFFRSSHSMNFIKVRVSLKRIFAILVAPSVN